MSSSNVGKKRKRSHEPEHEEDTDNMVWTVWFGERQRVSHRVIVERNDDGKRVKQIVLLNNIEVAVFSYNAASGKLETIRFARYARNKEHGYLYFDHHITLDYEDGKTPICPLEIKRGPTETAEEARAHAEEKFSIEWRRHMGSELHGMIMMCLIEGSRFGLDYVGGHGHLFRDDDKTEV